MVDSKMTYTEMDGRSEDELRQSLLNALMTSTITDDKFPVDKNSFQLSNMNDMSTDTMTSMPISMTTVPNIIADSFYNCENCSNSTCNLPGYTDEDCFIKWNPNPEDGYVRFYMKIKTPMAPSWYALGFNGVAKKMVNLFFSIQFNFHYCFAFFLKVLIS